MWDGFHLFFHRGQAIWTIPMSPCNPSMVSLYWVHWSTKWSATPTSNCSSMLQQPAHHLKVSHDVAWEVATRHCRSWQHVSMTTSDEHRMPLRLNSCANWQNQIFNGHTWHQTNGDEYRFLALKKWWVSVYYIGISTSRHERFCMPMVLLGLPLSHLCIYSSTVSLAMKRHTCTSLRSWPTRRTRAKACRS